MPNQNNIALLHRKEWQMMTPAPSASVAAAFMVAAGSGNQNKSLLVLSAVLQYLYDHAQDGFVQIPSGALAGTFGAGACGAYNPWSITYTANGGSTTTATVAAATHNINAFVEGETIEFISSGINNGIRRKITNVRNNAGAGTITLTFDSPVPTAVLNTHTFRISSGRFFIMSAGTTAAGSWKTFDLGTMAWQANLVTTNLPASWATDGKAVSTAKMANVEVNGTATAGSTTTLTDSTKAWVVDEFKNHWVLIVDGTGEGQMVKIISNTATQLTFATLATGLDATSVYQIFGSKPGFASGLATAGGASTLTNGAKAWTTNQWTNYQVRIVSGTGAGQIRTIASNTGTVLTTSSAWGTQPDSTSVYIIEGNEDYIYLAGNNAVTMYRYSISGNAWTVMAPTVARSAAPGLGMCLDWVSETGNSNWADESDIQDGRYIYSMRGGAGGLIDRFDIAGGTAGAGAWAAVTYIATETFTTGSSAFQSGRYLYIRKDATHRFFRFDIVGNHMEAFNTNTYPDGAALLGNKIWVKNLDPTENVKWLYSIMNTGTALHRIMII
jgi:hypothetical protein